MADDYIKRSDALDAVFHQYCASSDETEEALGNAIEEIRAIPTADVQEVVQCKDCIHGSPFRNTNFYQCNLNWICFPKNYFCSNARKVVEK